MAATKTKENKKKATAGLIYQLMPKLIEDIGHISKDFKNTGQNYKFRGIDQVYAALQPLLVKHQITLTPQFRPENFRVEKLERGCRATVTLFLTWVAPDGSAITSVVPGEGLDFGDKATYKALSGAFKYAVFQTLCIPTEEQIDAEFDSPIPPNSKEVERITKLLESAKTSAERRKIAEEIAREGLCEEDKEKLREVYNRCSGASG